MAALSAGSYGLSQQGGLNDENKELIFVKLTDSALRAIEEFQRTQAKLGSSSGNPSIQFLQNGQGCLSFPSGGNNVQKFNFSITDFDTGSIECIQQTQGQLQNMGHIPHKMRIHANDDVYEATRNRFTAAEENQKNKCTREIKPNQNEIGRKGKLKTPNFRNIPNSNAVVSKRDSIYNNSSVNKASSLAASQLTSNNNINSYNNPATSPKLVKTNGVHQPHQSVPQQQQQQQQHQQPQQQNNHHLQHQTQLASVQAKPGYQHTIHDPPNQQQQSALQKQSENANVPSRIANGRKTGNADYMKCNIKERLIHMLALKSYKRPELIVKLQQDGVRKEEMKCTTQILRNISTTRDGMLILHRNIWNEVQDDWPFYSEQDRQAVKRRRPQNLTPPLSSDGGSSASGQSPSSTHNGNSPQSGSKRPVGPGTEETTATPYSKKQRISHYKKDTHPDHMSNQFTRITTVEQRRRYKTEFDNEYKEYRRLHEVLEHASRKFAQYEEDLQHEPKDTPRYKEIQMKIIKEYDRSIKNVKFQQDKERFNYLHKKLSHIKLLVRDYDSSITNGGLCRPQENY
ncbi:RNA polymerase II elongation factor Ell-like isoform X5 [Anopheles albimanus]|uniref:RNA polymerase II elongation factor Ell-like isoform X5 n=1 Tax=Anopheles albimanus TaxID=7167 RepID=UPI00163F1486|nr:RNA polymerase II elongation factor Ell-like isoform X5 [Anopheles albimanus]